MFKKGDWIRIKDEASCLSVEIKAGLDPSMSYQVIECTPHNVVFQDINPCNSTHSDGMRVRKISNYELYNPRTTEYRDDQKEDSYESATNESTNTAWGRF